MNDAAPEPEWQDDAATAAGNQQDIGLVVKIALTIIFVVSFAVSLTALLTYFNFKKSYAEITQARYLVLAGNLQKSLEYSMNVGVNLNELENAQLLLNEVASKNPDVTLLRVVNSNNRILFDKDVTLVGQQSPNDMARAKPIADTHNHLLNTNELFVLDLPLHNNFGEQVGELRIGYARALTTAYLQKTAWFLLQHTGLSISIVALIVLIAVYVMTHTFRKRITAMGIALDKLMLDSSHDPDEISYEGGLEKSYLAFHEKTQELLYSFDATARDLDQLEKEHPHA